MNKEAILEGSKGVTEVHAMSNVSLLEKYTFPYENQELTNIQGNKGNHITQTFGIESNGVARPPVLQRGRNDPFIESGHPGCPRYPQSVMKSAVQPPVISPTLREQVSALVNAAQESKLYSLPGAKPIDSIADRYFVQITAWTYGLSPVQRSRRYSIGEVMLLAALKGHFRDHASLRYTGEALRRCGFTQKRDWTAAGRNKRYWQLVGDEK
jgi:hypothetical protein